MAHKDLWKCIHLFTDAREEVGIVESRDIAVIDGIAVVGLRSCNGNVGGGRPRKFNRHMSL